MKGGDLKLCFNYELTKDIPYLNLAGELWVIFSEFLGEKMPQYI